MSSSSSLSMSGPVPIPFITQDPRNPAHFVIDPTAAKLLSNIKGRICPVVVAGPYRSGKSTLLNLLLPPSSPSTSSSSSKRAGFAVGSSVEAVTKGIWLWGEPVHVKESGKTLLFLDSEGLGSLGSQATFDVQMFSLSLLLSSLFVLNTQGAINENALEQLELVLQMTERVRAREPPQPQPAAASAKRSASSSSSSTPSSSDSDMASLAAHFPDFLWVLRDFFLQLEDASGSPITAREYLENALRPVKGGARAAEKNRIRSVLSTVFPHRDCVPLVRPVEDEKKLQRLAQLTERDLRPEFVAQINRLRQRVYEQAKEKTVEGSPINGPAYLALAHTYLQSMNSGGIPVIHSAWTSVVELQGKEGLDEALRTFTALLRQATGALLTTADFDHACAEARSSALQVLREYAIGDADVQARLTALLTTRMDEVAERERRLNASQAREHNSAACAAAWKKVGGDALVDAADGTHWTDAEQRFLAEYEKHAKGEGKDDIGRRLLGDKKDLLMQRLVQRRAAELKEAEAVRKEKEAVEKRASKAEAELSQRLLEASYAKKELDRLQAERKAAEDEKKTAQHERNALQDQLREAQAEAKRARREHNTEVDDLCGRLKKAEAESKRFSEQLDLTVRERKQSESEADDRHRRELAQKERELASMRRELQEATKDLDSARDASLEDKHASDARHEKERTAWTAQLQAKERELKALNAAHTDTDDRVVRLQSELKKAREDVEFYRDRAGAEAEANEELRAENARSKEKPEESQPKTSFKKVMEGIDLQRAQANSAAAAQSVDHSRKRRREDADVELKHGQEHDDGMQFDSVHDDDGGDVNGADEPSSRYPLPPSSSPPARPSTAMSSGGRKSLAPSRVSTGAGAVSEEAVNPASLTIQQLKSWLTEMDVALPVKAGKRDFYVDLVYQHEPELEQHFPRRAQPAAKGKK